MASLLGGGWSPKGWIYVSLHKALPSDNYINPPGGYHLPHNREAMMDSMTPMSQISFLFSMCDAQFQQSAMTDNLSRR